MILHVKFGTFLLFLDVNRFRNPRKYLMVSRMQELEEVPVQLQVPLNPRYLFIVFIFLDFFDGVLEHLFNIDGTLDEGEVFFLKLP